MNIHVGDEIELTEEVVPENTAELENLMKDRLLLEQI